MRMKMKKVLLLILTILVVLVGGCSCDDRPVEPPIPSQKTDTEYLTVKQGELTYMISKEDMFINLRNTIGVSTIVNWANEIMVKTLTEELVYEKEFGDTVGFNDLSKVTYWDLVTEDEITKEIETEKFGYNKDSLTAEQIQKLETKFLENYYGFGYRTEEDIRHYNHVKLALDKLAKDYQLLEFRAKDFGKAEYEYFWKLNYRDTYNMVLLSFESEASYKATLKELGIEVVDGGNGYYKWVHSDTKQPLTTNEVVENYINVYNSLAKIRGTELLVEGKDYKVVEGKYVFETKEEGLTYYSSEAMKSFDEKFYDQLQVYAKPYNEESSTDLCNWYFANGYSDGINGYSSMLVLNHKKNKTLDEAHDEVKEFLLNRSFNDEYIEEITSTYRSKLNLLIYDQFLQTDYLTNYGGGSIPVITVGTDDIVAIFNDVILREDEFFDLMDKKFGPYIVGELINYYNVLYDKNINKVYDLSGEKTESERVLNKEKWEFAKETAALEKADFMNNVYATYGYPASFGWENFLIRIYDVRTDKELALHYLRENILFDYLTGLYSLANYDENSRYWKAFEKNMKERADEYFNANGFKIDLGYYDGKGNPIDPKDWTREQKELVEELYRELVTYFTSNPTAYEEKQKALMTLYFDSAYLLGENKKGEILLDGKIDLSKYKTAGIVLIYDSLGTFTNGDLDEPISNAAKKLWDENPLSDTPQVYGWDNGTFDYIVTSKGYHVYFNIRNNDMNRFEERNTPTLEEIKMYIENENTENLTDSQKYMVTNYYIGLYKELVGIYNSARMFYLDQANYEYFFKTNNYTKEEYLAMLNITIKETSEQLFYNFEY